MVVPCEVAYVLLVNSIRPAGAIVVYGIADMHAENGAAAMVHYKVAKQISNAYQEGREGRLYVAQCQ